MAGKAKSGKKKPRPKRWAGGKNPKVVFLYDG
jgi:hypothetical protein